MDASCPHTDAATEGFGDSDSPDLGLARTEEETYVDSLVRVSLLLASQDLCKVRDHGSKMLKHLLKHRSEKLTSADHLKLKLQMELVKLHTDSVLESPEAISEETVTKIEKTKEYNHNKSLLVLAARNNLRTQKTGEADGVSTSSTPGSSSQSISLGSGQRPLVSGDERVDLPPAVVPSFHSGETVSPPMPLVEQQLWVSEDERIDLTIDQTLQQNKSSCSLPQDPHLHSLPFPIGCPVPISLGTQPDYSDTQKRLVLNLESDGRSNSSDGCASTNSYSPGEIDGSILSKSDGSSPEKSDGSSDSSSSISDKKTQSSDWSKKAMGIDEMMSSNQGTDCLLLTEHHLLCEAFVTVTSYPGIQQYTSMLPCLLNSLDRIWTQMEWNDKYVDTVSGLSNLFSDGQFLRMSYRIVKFCEEKLTRSLEKGYGACDVSPLALLQSTIPLFLRLLRCIHALWSVEIGIGWLPQEVDMAKSLSCEELDRLLGISDGLYTVDSNESFHENETRALLEGTRQRVYNFIGLCTTVEGAFSLLDSLSFSNAFMEALECMEFRHLGKLIHLVVVPLVKHCPSELWEKWTVNFLKPILLQCEHRLHVSWFYLLYGNQAENLLNYGNLVGEDEQIKSLGYMLLLEFTRRLSGLLEALALMEQTSVCQHDVKPVCNKDTVSSEDLNSMAPSSLFRFLLHHDCFGKLRMSLFGYFVDDEAARKALQFCHCLIRLAVSTNDGRLRLLIVNDLLPCLIRRLDNELDCAVQRLRQRVRSSTTASADQELLALCKDLYVNLVKDSDGKDKEIDYAENSFESWLTKENGNLQGKAGSAAKELPDGSDWNWEFEDEFQRYLPAYMEMLQQVDSMDACEVYGRLEEEALFRKLATDFRSKYGINSRKHPYMLTISSLRQRQCYSMSGILKQREKIKFISELLKLKPYIKVSDCPDAIIRRLQESSEMKFKNPGCAVLPSLDLLDGLLSLWEPVYHPLIRESHMDILLRKIDQYIKANGSEHCQQVVPATLDFELHLQPYAYAYFEDKLKESMYLKAKEQIRQHDEFDRYLASGELDHLVGEFISSKDDFVKDHHVEKFQDLDHDLMKLSLEWRSELVEIRNQVRTYSCSLRSLLKDESLQGNIEELMNKLSKEGFFDTDNDSVNWECFSELVNEFGRKVFAGHSLPRHYVIRGIMDYGSVLNASSDVDALKAVAVKVCDRWLESCDEFWMETRYYEHTYYDIVRRPLEQVFLKKDLD